MATRSRRPARPGAGRTRDRIVARAAPLFAGGARPSIEEVLDAAQVSRATFYRWFDSRAALLRELDVGPDQSGRQRVLAAALDLIGTRGLVALNMDDLAAAASVSRANLYRLFPGKPALLRELLREYSPIETVAQTLADHSGEPPEIVMPALARAVASVLGRRPGLVRTLFYEVTAATSDAAEAVEWALQQGIGALLSYLTGQMAEGRLRRVSPILALQGFMGPILFHLLTRPLAESRLGLDIDIEDAVTELALGWVRAMTPESYPTTTSFA